MKNTNLYIEQFLTYLKQQMWKENEDRRNADGRDYVRTFAKGQIDAYEDTYREFCDIWGIQWKNPWEDKPDE